MDLWIKAQQKVLRQSQAANRGRRPGAAKYLLSMMIRCDKCSSPMIVNPGKTGKKGYACRARGCVRINMEELDRFVERLILRWLSDPEQYSALAHRGDDADSELADVRRNLDAARTELAELASQVANGALSVSFAATVEPGIQRRIKELEKRELELATPSALVSLITPGVDVEARWDAAPIGTKREIVRLLLSPEVLGELRVVRIGPGRRVVPVQDRIKWRRVPAAA